VTAVDTRLVVTATGIYDMTAEEYHADPVPGGSLSSSGARKLLPPSCPAIFRHDQLHGRPPKRTFDFGHAAHKEVLGTGPELVVIDADSYRTKAAQAARAAAYADGAVPLLPDEYDQVQSMADAILRHPVASVLFDPTRGRAEQNLFWRDPATGVWRRARLDWLPDQTTSSRMIIPEYKSTISAEPSACMKTIYTYGYHQQADWNSEGVLMLELAEDVAFVFVMQEKTPPYLVTVVEPDTQALAWGSVLNQKAIDVYARCQETGVWPGYTDDVVLASLPPYALRAYEAAEARGEYDREIR
jgi:hypothetical protein